MLKYISKFFLEIFPSIIATVIGAYIVNQYVIPRAGSDMPKAAAHAKTAPAEDQGAVDMTPKPDVAPTQEAKGQEVKGRDAKDKPAMGKGSDSPSEESVDAVRAAPEAGRPISRERAIVRNAASAPAEALPPEGRRDANELARAAIERLRISAEATRQADTPGPARELRAQAHANVAVPPPSQQRQFVSPVPSAVNSVEERPRSADVTRPIPPADIPSASRPLDLQAAVAPATKPSVADDILSAARSAFSVVVPLAN